MRWSDDKHFRFGKWEISIYPKQWRPDRGLFDWQITRYIGGLRYDPPFGVYRWVMSIGPIDIWRRT